MGLEPPIKLWGLLHKQNRVVMKSDERGSGATIRPLTTRSWPRWWNWAPPRWPWPAARWFPWRWTCPWRAGEWSWRAAVGLEPVAAGRRARGGRTATGSEAWEGPTGWGSTREERRGSRRGAGSSTACWWVWMAWESPILKERGEDRKGRRQKGILLADDGNYMMWDEGECYITLHVI